MYTIGGGCSSLLHLFVQFPVLIALFGVPWVASQLPANPGPGDRYGSSASLTQMQSKLVQEHPELATKIQQLKTQFQPGLSSEGSEESLKGLLKITDSCTDIRVHSLSPDERREAAWIIHLDKTRIGPEKADQYIQPIPPRKE